MTDIRIEIAKDDVTEGLRRLHDIGEHMDPILHAIGRVLESRVRAGFDAGVDPYGQPWAPLRIRQGKPLRDTGQLQNSITYTVEGNSVVVGTNREHMQVHQFGAVIKPKNGKFLAFPGAGGHLILARQVTIPRRAFLPDRGLPQDWADDVLKAMGDEVKAAMSGTSST